MGVNVRKRNGAWWVFINHRGRRRAKRIGDRPTAERVAAEIRARLQLGDTAVLAPTKQDPTLAVYSERWLEAHSVNIKPRTVELYGFLLRRHLLPQLGELPLRAVTREKVRDFFAAKASAMKRTMALKIVGLLREVLNHALEDGHIDRNPAANLGRFYRGRTEEEARTPVVPLTAKEVGRLLEACGRWYPEFWEIIAMAAWSGMREGEILGLQWQDLDVAGCFAEVRRTISYRGGRVNVGSPKSGRARRVDLPAMLVQRLAARKSLLEAEAAVQGHDLTPWCFLNQAGKPIDAMNFLHRVWAPLLAKAGLRRIRFHDLRHTFASLLIQAGESLAYVKDQLGHSSIKITVDLYGHLVPGANRQAVDRLADATFRNPGATSDDRVEQEREGSVEENWSRGRELNPRPTDYESVALPLSYPGVPGGSRSWSLPLAHRHRHVACGLVCGWRQRAEPTLHRQVSNQCEQTHRAPPTMPRAARRTAQSSRRSRPGRAPSPTSRA